MSLGLGAGLVPRLPGTAGTVVGVIIYWPLQYLALLYYCLAVIGLFLLGIWFCHVTASHLGVHDHTAIVWDEIVGYLLTMIAVPAGWPWILGGFVLFRLFDIWKPWPISLVDQSIGGGLGIMLDDALAAFFALCILQISSFLL